MNAKVVDVAVGIIIRDGDVLLCQRKKSARYALKWEFPGGKHEPGETAEECLHRELQEELGIMVAGPRLYFTQKYEYPDSGTFNVTYFVLSDFSGVIENKVFEAFEWVPVQKLSSYDILEGNIEVVNRLMHEHPVPLADSKK
jgi:8-oxo-dGTP diphosphatase